MVNELRVSARARKHILNGQLAEDGGLNLPDLTECIENASPFDRTIQTKIWSAWIIFSFARLPHILDILHYSATRSRLFESNCSIFASIGNYRFLQILQRYKLD